MNLKFIILGCGSSLGVPRIDGDFGNCNPKNKKNIRTRCCALITSKDINILIDASPDIKDQFLRKVADIFEEIDFSKIILKAILINSSGIFHYGSINKISKYDFAIQFSKMYKLNSNLINSVSYSTLPFIAKRPINSTLNMIDTKNGEEKKSALAVANGMYVKDIKKAENAIKCNTTLNTVKEG